MGGIRPRNQDEAANGKGPQTETVSMRKAKGLKKDSFLNIRRQPTHSPGQNTELPDWLLDLREQRNCAFVLNLMHKFRLYQVNGNHHKKTQTSNEIYQHCHPRSVKEKESTSKRCIKMWLEYFPTDIWFIDKKDVKEKKYLIFSDVCLLRNCVYYYVYNLCGKGFFLRNINPTVQI